MCRRRTGMDRCDPSVARRCFADRSDGYAVYQHKRLIMAGWGALGERMKPRSGPT